MSPLSTRGKYYTLKISSNFETQPPKPSSHPPTPTMQTIEEPALQPALDSFISINTAMQQTETIFTVFFLIFHLFYFFLRMRVEIISFITPISI